MDDSREEPNQSYDQQDDEIEKPKRKGRPPGTGRKEKDFEELLAQNKEKSKDSARKNIEKQNAKALKAANKAAMQSAGKPGRKK